jgi:hypothetical protein
MADLLCFSTPACLQSGSACETTKLPHPKHTSTSISCSTAEQSDTGDPRMLAFGPTAQCSTRPRPPTKAGTQDDKTTPPSIHYCTLYNVTQVLPTDRHPTPSPPNQKSPDPLNWHVHQLDLLTNTQGPARHLSRALLLCLMVNILALLRPHAGAGEAAACVAKAVGTTHTCICS